MTSVVRKAVAAEALVFTGKNAATVIVPFLREYFKDQPEIEIRNNGSTVKIYIDKELQTTIYKRMWVILGDGFWDVINDYQYKKFYALEVTRLREYK